MSDDKNDQLRQSATKSSRALQTTRVRWLTGLSLLGVVVSAVLASQESWFASSADAQSDATRLRPAASFANISDLKQRSLALFAEAGKVITHPRCVNCHPSGDSPLQGQGEPHSPGAVRGDDGFGAVGMRCQTCHQAENYAPSGVPGHPKWHVAPLEMAWQGKSLGQICAQIKDPKRNGNMTLAQLQHHMAKDTLVGWGWNPGAKREPVPGTQEAFGELIAAWVASGAECPEP